MLIPVNEHYSSWFQGSGAPELTFDGRTRFDGIATAKTCL